MREVADEHGNILRTVPQGRRHDWKDIKAVIEIAAELLIRDHPGQIPVGRRYQTDVDTNGAVAPQPLELLLLQDAQQLGLQLERNVADLIEEQGALVRQFEPADLLCDGARESPPFMAEQLAFEQPRRNRRAVHLDEGPLATLTQVVDRASDELLACAGFPLNQRSGVGRRDGLHLLQDALQRCALPDDLLEVVLGADLVFEVELLFGKLLLEVVDLSKG